ncbi:hypothetical protein Hte_010551 [Hypoxylon texense]
MALVVTNIGRSKSEIELGKAVSDFEDILSPEQKAGFRMIRASAVASPPNVRDVMNLTAEIDEKARRQKGGSHRCFGPRFTMILESVQQYASLGDIIAGGSQNLFACGAWAIVRTTLLTAVKLATYLDRISLLFMRVGLSAPRYHEMASLFPQSKPLQALMAQYFTTIIRICYDTVRLCQKSFLGQMKAFFQDGNIAEYESQIADNTNAIREQLQIEKMKNATAVYSMLQSLTVSGTRRKALQSHLQLLDQCSTYPYYRTAWKRIRKQGNATWAYEQAAYKTWLDQDISSSLLFRGKLGSGKSVQLANMVDDLNLHHPKNRTAYFFCCQDDSQSLECRTILGCLARQLLEQLPVKVSAELSNEFRGELDESEIQLIIGSALDHAGQTVFIIDGLEACATTERVLLLRTLATLQTTHRLKICVSFSLEASNEVEKDMDVLCSRMSLTLPHERPELSPYIEVQLISKLQDGSLVIGDPHIILEIRDAIQAGAQGMFLWARLQIESLCFEKTDEDIRKALQHLPRNLSGIFRRILDQCRNEAPDYQLPILKILAAARRPLSLDEFGEAISLTPGDADLSPTKIVNDTRNVLRCCGSLVILDEELFTLHLIHPSVRQFLLGEFKGHNGVPFSIEDAEQELGHRIVTYLNWEGFNAQLSTKTVPTLPADGIPKKIINLSLNDSSKVRSMAIGLLKSQSPKHDVDIGKVLSAEIEQFRGAPISQFHFLAYAKRYWLHHTNRIHESSGIFPSLFEKLVHKPDLVEGSIGDDGSSADMKGKVVWAIYQSHSALLLAITGNDIRKAQDVNCCVRAAGKMRPHKLLDETLWYDLLGIIAQGYHGEDTEKTALADFIQMHPKTWVDCNPILERASQNVFMLRDYVALVAQIKDEDGRRYIPSAGVDVYGLCGRLLQAFPEDVSPLADLLSLVDNMTDESYNGLLNLLLQSPAHLEACKEKLADMLKQNYRTPLIDPNVFVGFFEAFDPADYASDEMLLRAILRLCPNSNAAYDRVLRTLAHFPRHSRLFIAVLCKSVPLPLIDPTVYIKLARVYTSSCDYGKARRYYEYVDYLSKSQASSKLDTRTAFRALVSLRPVDVSFQILSHILKEEMALLKRNGMSSAPSSPTQCSVSMDFEGDDERLETVQIVPYRSYD